MTADDSERMRRAYRVSGGVMREELRQERPDDARELDGVSPGRGGGGPGAVRPHRAGAGGDAGPLPADDADGDWRNIDWERLQVLLVCCPGHLPPDALEAIGPWVRRGGYLLTTDWALKHVVEPLFPGTVRHNGQQTPGLRGAGGERRRGRRTPSSRASSSRGATRSGGSRARRTRSRSSTRSGCKVLVKSREVGERWGADPVVVTFDEGHGTVLHLLSHLYLQRSDVREAADARPASDWLDAESSAAEQPQGGLRRMAGDLTGARAALERQQRPIPGEHDHREEAPAGEEERRRRGDAHAARRRRTLMTTRDDGTRLGREEPLPEEGRDERGRRGPAAVRPRGLARGAPPRRGPARSTPTSSTRSASRTRGRRPASS